MDDAVQTEQARPKHLSSNPLYAFSPDAIHLRRLLELLLAIAIALGTGLGSAWYVVGEGWLLRTDVFGEWASWPMGSSPDADPYSRAVLARTGQVPLASGEGTAFFASRDSSGKAIRGGCEYEISGRTPPVRLWTLTLIDATGDLPSNTIGRTFMRGDEILRDPTGAFDIVLSAEARPGNWFPIPKDGFYTLVLRLYDTPASLLADLRGNALPHIERKACT